MQQTLAIFLKDFRLEWRSRFAVSTVLAFIVSSLLVVLFSLRADLLTVPVQSGILWILILFASLITLSRIFVYETERKTMDVLRLNAPATAVFLGKYSYNFLFTLLITSVSIFLFTLMANMQIYRFTLLLPILLLGSSGLAGATTILAALVSQASRKGAIFPVLALPLVIPLLLVLVRVTQSVFQPAADDMVIQDLLALIGFTGVTLSASILLFEYLWQD